MKSEMQSDWSNNFDWNDISLIKIQVQIKHMYIRRT